MQVKKIAAIAAVAVLGLGGVALADTKTDAPGFYLCIGNGNKVLRSYPIDGWHGNHCSPGEWRQEIQSYQVVPPTADPPAATTPPVTDPPATDPPDVTPVSNDWPDASNTGPQAGVALSDFTGATYITAAGTTIENKIIHGNVTIKASNVTIKNCIIYGEVRIDDNAPDVSGVLLSHVEVDGQGMASGNGINEYAVGGPYGGGFTLEYANIHGWETGVTINSDFDKTVVRESWIHDLGPSSNDHKAGLSANSAGNADIIHNSIDCEVSGCSGAMVLYGDFGPIKDWDVEGNLFNSEGGYCTHSGADGQKFPNQATGITWKNNAYGRQFYNSCGQYGAATAWDNDKSNTWSGNYWADTKAIIPAP